MTSQVLICALVMKKTVKQIVKNSLDPAPLTVPITN